MESGIQLKEFGIQLKESGVHDVESRIPDCLGFPCMERNHNQLNGAFFIKSTICQKLK